jgi:hypothetical protein
VPLCNCVEASNIYRKRAFWKARILEHFIKFNWQGEAVDKMLTRHHATENQSNLLALLQERDTHTPPAPRLKKE